MATSQDTVEIERQGSALQAKAAEVEVDLDTLHSQITTLRDTWSGRDAEAFHGLYDQFEQQRKALQQTLDSIGRSLVKVAGDYDAVETAAAAAFAPR